MTIENYSYFYLSPIPSIETQLIGHIMGDDRSVSIECIPVKDGIKIVEICDAEDENSADRQRQDWQSILDNFFKYVETRV